MTIVRHRHVEVDGIRIFYRVSEPVGPVDAPTLLLLHGFPSASHQYRRIIELLGDRFRLIAPDYPGFGHSDAPDRRSFHYSFDHLADIVEGFVTAVGLERFVLYAFDYGAPVGFRLATRHPEWIAGLVVQNGNAYQDGLSDLARQLLTTTDPQIVRGMLTLPVTRGQHEDGAGDVTRIAPEGWVLDQYFLDLPGRKDIQVDLMLDYHRNVELYPAWQEWLRQDQPPALIVWGRNDGFFIEAGAHAYRRDLPEAELHLLDTGHFALDECVDDIAPLIGRFLEKVR